MRTWPRRRSLALGEFGKSPGRPRGSRNKLAKRVFEDLIDVWDEPIAEGSTITRGVAALRIMSKQNPCDFCKLYGSLMPREFWIDSTAQQLSDEELDAMIEQLRQRAIEARQAQAIEIEPAPMKVIANGNAPR